MENVYLNLRKTILWVFKDCLSKEKEAWKCSLDEVIIGDGKINDFTFDAKKLNQHRSLILQLLGYLGALNDEFYFNSLKTDRKGYAWTELNSQVEMLVALGNALNVLEFKKNKLEWTKEDYKNPELICTLNR